MRKFIAIIIFILLTVNIYSDAFSDWKKKQNQAFAEFKQDEDNEFRAFLEKEWQEFQVFKGIIQDETPKIEEPPVSDKLNLFDFSIGKLFNFGPKNKTDKPVEQETGILTERSVDLSEDISEETETTQKDRETNIGP